MIDHFVDELKRRKVVRVAVVYAATAFVVLQAADLLAAGLALPAWVFAAITLVTVLGFPLALVLAWAFQITPEGVQRTDANAGATERWLSRRTVAVVAVALLLVVGGGWFMNPVIADRLARMARVDAPTGPVIATLAPPPGEYWADGRTAFEVSPDGRTVAFVGGARDSADAPLLRRLMLRDLERYTTTPLPNTLGASYPFWSPDGASLAFFANGQLRVLDVASRQVRTLCPAAAPRGGTWGTGNVILYAPTPWGGLHRTTAAGGACEPVPWRNSAPPQGGRPYFLADGRHYVFSAAFESWLGRVDGDSLTLLEQRTGSEIGGRAVFAHPDYLLVRAADGGLEAHRIDVRRRRLTGPPRRLFDHVHNPGNWTTVSASANGVLVVQGPGSTRYRVLEWTDRSGRTLDSLVVTDRVWAARPSHAGGRVALAGRELSLHDRARGVGTTLLTIAQLQSMAGDSLPNITGLVWAPGDTLIAFRRARAPNVPGTGTIGLLDPRTGVVRTLDLPAEQRGGLPQDWSADGRLLAFTLPRGEGRAQEEAWVYDFATSQARQLLDHQMQWTGDVRFSPDGRWIAWQAAGRDLREVFVRPLEGAGAPLQVSAGGGIAPRWSPDGRELYYMSPQGLMAVTVRLEAMDMLSAPRLLRTLPPNMVEYQPTGDGGFMLHRYGGETPGHTLVLNWTRLLEQEEER